MRLREISEDMKYIERIFQCAFLSSC